MSSPVGTVPIVDLSLPEAEAAQHVRAACTTSGFFYIKQHGVAEQLVSDVFQQQREAFALPLEVKRGMIDTKNNRGWTPFNEETLDPTNQTIGDTKEGFYIGREVTADSPEASKPLHGPNVWPPPELLPSYRAVTQQYFDALHALGLKLLRLLAMALDMDASFFDSYFQRPMIMLRPLHYTAQVSQPEAGVFGAGAHSDYGMLTILATDEVPGLQIYTGDSAGWQDVLPVEGAFIINLGDMLERWTNGLFQSTLHRVISTSGRERYSIAFFFEPNFEASVECLPNCCSEDNPPRYPPTTAGQHLLDKYAQTHSGYKGPIKMDGVKT